MRLFTRKALAYVKCVPAASFQAFGRKTWKPRPCMYGTALLVTLIAVAFEPGMNSLMIAVSWSTMYIHMSMWPVPSTVNGSCGRMCSVSMP